MRIVSASGIISRVRASTTDEGFDGAATPAKVRGDGFSVHDEYRGFHVLDSGSRRWISTDPTKQDLFYTDPDGIAGGALNTIFGALTGSFITLRKVAPTDASSKNNQQNLGDGVNPLNRNSLFPSTQGFALVYKDKALREGIVGQSAPDGVDGSANNGWPILIDKAKITGIARTIAPTGGMSEGLLLAQVLAHETGHKLGRPHTTRGASNIPYAPDVTQVTTTTFMRGPGMQNQLYTRFLVYRLGTQARMDEKPFNLGLFVLNRDGLAPFGTGPAPPDSVYRIICKKSSTTIDTPALVTILDQDGTLMNWAPKLSQTSAADWNFRAADQERSKLCLLPIGCR
jgi:hypothetical protein